MQSPPTAAKVSVKNGCVWALDACAWANAEGLFTDALGTLDLCAPASRAEIAYWLAHFDVGTSASSLTEGSFEGLGYLLYTPENAEKNMPLLVYLPGGHGKGSDLSVLTTTDGFPQYLADGLLGEVPAYVLIPQLPANEKGWLSSAGTVMALIDTICEEKTIDRSRIALTGHSMGGTGTWDLALAYPDIFSRIAPMSGSIKTTADTLKTFDTTSAWINGLYGNHLLYEVYDAKKEGDVVTGGTMRFYLYNLNSGTDYTLGNDKIEGTVWNDQIFLCDKAGNAELRSLQDPMIVTKEFKLPNALLGNISTSARLVLAVGKNLAFATDGEGSQVKIILMNSEWKELTSFTVN